jgi:hypothetical protein
VTPRREGIALALALVLGKLAVGAWVLHQGFSHVSDDDFARTVIAQRFAHAPALDPSGTSWLPVPFWVTGVAMMAAGRTIGVARAVAAALAAASVAAPYAAMRAAGVARLPALAAAGIAMALPWNAWLGVAAVPEGWFGALVAAAAVAMPLPRARPWAAAALLAASLSRYEAWPACAAMAGLCAWSAARSARAARTGDAAARADARRDVACALVAAAGPVAWMAWNAHAHADALHFVARVTTFRQSVGAADVPLTNKLLGYPRALLRETPEVAVLGAASLVGLASPAWRARWRWPAVVVAAVLAFLVWGDVRDGAPTHHPARALAATWWVLVAMGVDALAGAAQRVTGASPRAAAWVGGAAAVACAAWAVTLPARWADAPGRGEAERREEQIARGVDMRARDVQAARITPCAFEHFAVLAAWGAPERATVEPRTGRPVGPDCPQVEER